MNTIYNMDVYTLGTFALACFIIGVFAGWWQIGRWFERHKLGRRPFIVNPSPDIVIDDDGIYLSPMTCDELEHMLYKEYQARKESKGAYDDVRGVL